MVTGDACQQLCSPITSCPHSEARCRGKWALQLKLKLNLMTPGRSPGVIEEAAQYPAVPAGLGLATFAAMCHGVLL